MSLQRCSRCSSSHYLVNNSLPYVLVIHFWTNYLQTIGVPPERQKVMVGGVTLQNDDWGKAKSKIKEVCVNE